MLVGILDMPIDHAQASVLIIIHQTASVARHIYLRSGVGVGALKKNYGGRQNRGSRPHHHAIGSGSIARKVVQALEKIKVLEKDTNGYAYSLWLCCRECQVTFS